MSRVLVDSNVWLDVFAEDPAWEAWSAAALAAATDAGPVVMNAIVYAEISQRFSDVAALDALLPSHLVHREPIPWPAAFLAGKAYLAYRRRGGTRHSPLPDFFIGAHAAVAGYALLTRDAARYRSYFPRLKLIAPGIKPGTAPDRKHPP